MVLPVLGQAGTESCQCAFSLEHHLKLESSNLEDGISKLLAGNKADDSFHRLVSTTFN